LIPFHLVREVAELAENCIPRQESSDSPEEEDEVDQASIVDGDDLVLLNVVDFGQLGFGNQI